MLEINLNFMKTLDSSPPKSGGPDKDQEGLRCVL